MIHVCVCVLVRSRLEKAQIDSGQFVVSCNRLKQIMSDTEAGTLKPPCPAALNRETLWLGVMNADGPLSSISPSSYGQASSTTRISVAEMECYYHLLGVCQETAGLKSMYTSPRCLYASPSDTSRAH